MALAAAIRGCRDSYYGVAGTVNREWRNWMDSPEPGLSRVTPRLSVWFPPGDLKLGTKYHEF